MQRVPGGSRRVQEEKAWTRAGCCCLACSFLLEELLIILPRKNDDGNISGFLYLSVQPPGGAVVIGAPLELEGENLRQLSRGRS